MTDEPKTPEQETESTTTDEATPEETSEETTTSVATEDEPTPEEAQTGDEETTEEPDHTKVIQTVELTDIGPCKKHIKVSIDRASIDSCYDSKFSELRTDIVVPGFRKGKAPRKVIEKMYVKDVSAQVKQELLMASLQQMAEDYDVAPLTQPNLHPDKITLPDTGPMIYEFEVEVRPDFDLPEYKGLQLERQVRTFTDEEIGRERRRLLSRYGQLVPKEEEPVALEDYIIADMTTEYNGQVIGQSKELTLRVDNRLAFKDGVSENFGEKVVGAVAGDKREVDITMSNNVAAPQLVGLTVKATLDIKDVKQVRLPELTHELLHTFGCHSEEELNELIKEALERRLAYQQRQYYREQILEKIESQVEWDLPQDLLARQAKNAMSRRAMEMREGGMTDDQIKSRLQVMQQDIIQSTASSLKEHFVLQKIAEAEKIDASEDDINDEIEAIAEESDESPRRVRARLEREDSLDSLVAMIIERKTLDLIIEKAELTDVDLDEEDDEVATAEEQAVEGELQDHTKVAEETEEGEEGVESSEVTGD